MDGRSKSVTQKNVVYLIVNNIPKSYRSADLRNFFSEFIETSGFDCFHFRHRPEVRLKKGSEPSVTDDAADAATRTGTTCCCIARVEEDRVDQCLRMYDRKHWVGRDGQTLPTKCFIRRVRVGAAASNASQPRYVTRGEQSAPREDRQVISASDLKDMIELRPPPTMPRGNVGTPTKHFLGLIQSCRLPPRLIKKLGLEFPRSRARGLYGSVPFDYGTRAEWGAAVEEDFVRTASGAVISRRGMAGMRRRRESAAQKTPDAKTRRQTTPTTTRATRRARSGSGTRHCTRTSPPRSARGSGSSRKSWRCSGRRAARDWSSTRTPSSGTRSRGTSTHRLQTTGTSTPASTTAKVLGTRTLETMCRCCTTGGSERPRSPWTTRTGWLPLSGTPRALAVASWRARAGARAREWAGEASQNPSRTARGIPGTGRDLGSMERPWCATWGSARSGEGATECSSRLSTTETRIPRSLCCGRTTPPLCASGSPL
ncbi:unnamed protein product [Ixodes persulcatus]